MNTQYPLISVILSFYNNGAFIKESIDSILAQSYENIELILIDDGSTDNSSNIAREFAKTEKRVSYLRLNDGPHGIPELAKNVGLQMAKGQYITFQDSDDISHKERLQIQYHYLQDNPDHLFISCLMEEFSEQGGQRRTFFDYDYLTDKQIRRNLCSRNVIIEVCTLFRKETFDKYGIYTIDDTLPKDYEFWLKLWQDKEIIFSKIPRILYYRRCHNDQWNAINRNKGLIAKTMHMKVKTLIPYLLRNNRNRPLIVWGLGQGGRAIVAELQANSFNLQGIIDGNPDKWGEFYADFKIDSPLSIPQNNECYYIIATSEGRLSAREIMQEFNLKVTTDYIELV